MPSECGGWSHGLLSYLFRQLLFIVSDWCFSSWVGEAAIVGRLTPEIIDEVLATLTGPKQLIQAWEMARTPPGVFEYMLEKKATYHKLVEKYKSL